MDNDKIIEMLIVSGAMEFAGIDPESGEMLYNFTHKLKEIMPDLYTVHQNNINDQVMRFWEMGFVNLDLFADSPIVTLTDKAFDSDAISMLSDEDKISINEIKRVLLS